MALRADVYAFFSFTPEPLPVTRRVVLREVAFHDATFCSPQFADGHVSLVFELGRICDGNRWSTDPRRRGTVIGPMRHVGRMEGSEQPEMLGVYFRPARVAPLFRIAISDITDKSVGTDELWGSDESRVFEELQELDEMGRIDRLESTLLARFGKSRPRQDSVRMEPLAASVIRRRGRVTVEELARGAGVSRQHLTRQFRERLGVGPKLYCRLARFQSGLVYAGCRTRVDWAQAAVEMGYADQSHMIAELRQFSGLTPHALASRDWFHPFIERAKTCRWAFARP
jgi:AraC-like DNA-binding protein